MNWQQRLRLVQEVLVVVQKDGGGVQNLQLSTRHTTVLVRKRLNNVFLLLSTSEM